MDVLANLPGSAGDLSKALGKNKHATNQILYDLLKKGQVRKTEDWPPVWSAVEVSAMTAPPGNKVIVFLDLSNMPYLKQMVPYLERGLVEVHAFADLCFNGYGISPPLEVPGLQLSHSKSGNKNASDVELIWKAATLLTSVKDREVYVLTKDHGFLHLRDLIEELGHKCTFCASFEDFICHVE